MQRTEDNGLDFLAKSWGLLDFLVQCIVIEVAKQPDALEGSITNYNRFTSGGQA